MDIFRFLNPTAPTKLEQGKIVNGLKSKLWVERYAQPGEFKLVANADFGVQASLPIGSLISHTGSKEVMIVEDHEISREEDQPSEVIITGRSFESILDQRITGANRAFPTTGETTDYVFVPDYSWDQASLLIRWHIYPDDLVNPDDEIPYLTVLTQVSDVDGEVAPRSVKRGSLLSELLTFLQIDKLGIKTVRPGTWSPLGASSPNMALSIYAGEDKSADIMFSYDSGEILSADYLWSNRKLKNAALVSGRWVQTLVDFGKAGYARRVMHVDASDIDEKYQVVPNGTVLDDVIALMEQRGKEALSNKKNLSITKAEVSKHGTNNKYRVDFDLGDIVNVVGEYSASTKMRVTEYVEVEDETGESSYPTLAVDEEEF